MNVHLAQWRMSPTSPVLFQYCAVDAGNQTCWAGTVVLSHVHGASWKPGSRSHFEFLMNTTCDIKRAYDWLLSTDNVCVGLED